ncbi:MAG TPA: DNA polymerase III subunit epsilon [Devosia sp.]|nr:DNA polymerase III subunit epsilon [Devosia sp.]
MTREIVFDTETTGLDPKTDRIVEIGCVELINHIPTGRHFHAYLNPEMAMAEDAFRIHGLSDDFLKGQPLFAAKVDEFLEFCGDAILIAHNAAFDVSFFKEELARLNRAPLGNEIIDTVLVAREKHPGARVSLDALCKHYGIDNSRRTLHGALLDSQILAEVYLELIGGRQVALSLVAESSILLGEAGTRTWTARPRPVPLAARITEAEITAHEALVATLGKDAIWAAYLADEPLAN